MFENPHGLDELGEDEKSQLKLLYQVSANLFTDYRTRNTDNVKQDLLLISHQISTSLM